MQLFVVLLVAFLSIESHLSENAQWLLDSIGREMVQRIQNLISSSTLILIQQFNGTQVYYMLDITSMHVLLQS